MKKLLTILLAALLCVCCVSMVACKEEAGVEGTYKFYSLTYNGETYNIGDEFQGVEMTADTVKIELKKGGDCVMTTPNDESNATWAKDGNTITITSSYDAGGGTMTSTQTATINGTEMTMTANPDTPYEMTYVFKKA